LSEKCSGRNRVVDVVLVGSLYEKASYGNKEWRLVSPFEVWYPVAVLY